MKTKWTPEIACSPGCPGWAVFNGNEIQRCDACARFKDDGRRSVSVGGFSTDPFNSSHALRDDDAAIEHVIQIERYEIKAQLKQGRRGAK